MLFQSNILESRIQILKTKITNTEKSLEGRRLKLLHAHPTKVEVYNSIRHPINSESVPQTKFAKNNGRHEQSARANFACAFGLALGTESPGGPSKVTADTDKVAAPLDEEASSLAVSPKFRPSPQEWPP